jgi:hypothetical protein
LLQVTLLDFIVDLAIVVAFALIAIGASAIDRRGFLASLLVGYPILLGGGWRWFVIVATFFVLGVAFTWYRYEYKKSIGSAQEKGGTRNWPNILANGGVAALLGLGEFLGGGLAFSVLYVGAVSAAASDTVATELGLLNRSPPRLITHPMFRDAHQSLMATRVRTYDIARTPVLLRRARRDLGRGHRLPRVQPRARDIRQEELLHGLRETFREPRALRRADAVFLGHQVRRQSLGQCHRHRLRGARLDRALSASTIGGI